MWYGTVKLAHDCNVTIIKFRHTLQIFCSHFDVTVFQSLKDHWGKVLFRRMILLTRCNHFVETEFLKIICSEEVWDIAFSQKNVKGGFQKCGIIPVNRDSYPQHCYNANLLNHYNK